MVDVIVPGGTTTVEVSNPTGAPAAMDLALLGPPGANATAGDMEVFDSGGFPVYHRRYGTASHSMASQRVYFTYCTSPIDLLVGNLAATTYTPAAAATPTLIRLGLYAVEPDDSLTLIAATANDPSMFAAVTTRYTRPVTTPVPIVAGGRYALGILIVTSVTAPSLVSNTIQGATGVLDKKPYIATLANGYSDLPATLSTALAAGNGNTSIYGEILP